MKDIEIKISQETRMVDLKKTVLGNDAENLQGNLIFSFTDNFVNGTARLEYEISGNKRYIMLEKNNNTYSVPIKSVLTKKGQINMQLVITEGTSENDIPIFKSNIFYVFCNQSINAEIEQPNEYPSWIEIANAKINEVDEAILGIEEAKRYAVEQGNYAKEQGDYAKAQGDYAKAQKIEVVKANEEANKIITNFETNVSEYTTSFNDNAINKTSDFDSNVESKTSEFNVNADSKIGSYNTNASEKLNTYNTNSNNKIKEYNDNAISNTTVFNDNASNKTTYYNNNATTKLNEYNTNATNKTNEFNTNATSKLNDYNTNADTKLQEYNTNADNKIAEYDEHSQELNNKIIDTRNELERVKNDVLETGTDTDTYIHLEDSAMAEYQELSVDGVCEQETTSGKNHLPNNNSLIEQTINGIKFTPQKDGTIIANGTATANATFILYGSWNGVESFKNLKNNENYVLSGGDKNCIVQIRTLTNGVYKTHNSSTTTRNIENEEEIVYAEVQVFSGTTIKNFVFKPMVRLASIVDDTYEPYTGGQPSPSPDYPQPISVIENSLKITSCNKNLLDTEDIEINKSIKNDGMLNDNVDYFTSNIKPIKSNSNIVVSGMEWGRIAFYDNKQTFISYIANNNLANIKTITPNNAKYFRVSSTNETLNGLMVEYGTTVTPYEQHLETQITANLPDGEFIGKINDTYKDTLNVVYKDDGHYHLILNKMIGKVVLDGSENFNELGENCYKLSNFVNGYDDNSYILHQIYCNNFTSQEENFIYRGIKQGIAILGGTINALYISNFEGAMTLQDFKSWLSTHNTEVYYVLATPYEVDLGIVDTLLSYDEITNIFTDSDLLPTINAKYYRNFISTVRNLQVNEKALKQELVDINTRLSALETAQTNAMSESEVVE